MHHFAVKRRLDQQLKRHPMRVVSSLSFFTSFAVSAIWAIWSVYIDSYTNNPQMTSIIAAVFVAFSILCAVIAPKFAQKWGHRVFFFIGILFSGLGFIGLSFTNNIWLFVVFAIILYAANIFREVSTSILTRDASNKKTVSVNQGIRFVFGTLAFLLAPLIIGFIFTGTNFSVIFMASGIICVLSAIVGLFVLPKQKHHTTETHALKDLVSYWKDKERRLVYFMRIGLSIAIFYSFTYLPLVIKYAGLPPSFIGFAAFAITLPPIALDYFIAKAAPKLKFRNVFIWGFLIAGLFFVLAGFSSSAIWHITFIVGAGVGIAFLEPTIEAYFYEITKRKDEERFIGTYFTAVRLGNLVTKLGGAFLLFFVPLENLAAIFGIVLLGFIFLARKVKL